MNTSFSLSRVLVEISLKLVYFTMFGKNFQIYGVRIPRKCIRSRHFYLFPPSQLKLSPKFLSSFLKQREITHSPRQHFFENLFPPTIAERDEANYDSLYKNVLLYKSMKMTWNIRLIMFCIICIFFKCNGFTVL